MQSTGQASTHEPASSSMHAGPITYAIASSLSRRCFARLSQCCSGPHEFGRMAWKDRLTWIKLRRKVVHCGSGLTESNRHNAHLAGIRCDVTDREYAGDVGGHGRIDDD